VASGEQKSQIQNSKEAVTGKNPSLYGWIQSKRLFNFADALAAWVIQV
jgi:hypothetical protein